MIDELFDATVSFLPDCGSGDGAEDPGPGWFEPFPAHTPVRDEHRVCYWYGSRTSRFNAYLLVGFANRCTTKCFSTRATDPVTNTSP